MPPLHQTIGTPTGSSTPTLALGVSTLKCFSLVEYVDYIEYDEHRFWGVMRNDFLEYQCREFWTRGQRRGITRYLTKAIDLIEKELRYHICPTWDTDEEHPYSFPVLSKFDHVIEAGVQASSFISEGASVVHTDDPAKIGPITTTVTDTDEVFVYHPGTTEVIEPQQVSISNGQLTIYIPRCRLVPIASQGGTVDYDTVDDFLQTVDVVRVYNDSSTNAELVWPHQCTAACASGCSCTETTQDACMLAAHKEIGEWHVRPGTYSDGSWSVASPTFRSKPHIVRLNYRSGLDEITPIMKEAIIRLAHSLMPKEPCGCNVVQRLWKRDRNVPLVTDRERLNCPWGLSDGAWFAWNIAVSNESGWMGVL